MGIALAAVALALGVLGDVLFHGQLLGLNVGLWTAAFVAALSALNFMLRIPPETQNGRTFRLTGKGLPKIRGDTSGDLFVKVRVVLPTGLSGVGKAAAETSLELAGV